MAQPQLSRRERLELWRRETGRTPMKRLSYVRECWKGSGPQPLHNQAPTRAPSSVRRRQPLTTLSMKNNPPNQKERPKLSRREMLEQWLAIHGSTVRRPRSYLHQPPTTNPNKRGRRGRRHTFNAAPQTPSFSSRKQDSDTLRVRFQRDIEDMVTELCRGECGEDDPLAVQLDFDWETTESAENEELMRKKQVIDHREYTPPRKHKPRLSVRFNEALVCRSTIIRYSMALSEPQKRRHPSVTPGGKKLLHLTPVRRSMRKNRHGPGLSLDRTLCFDSPSEVHTQETYEHIHIIPNAALLQN